MDVLSEGTRGLILAAMISIHDAKLVEVLIEKKNLIIDKQDRRVENNMPE